MRRVALLFLLLNFSNILFAQGNLDSLRRSALAEKDEKARLEMLLSLASQWMIQDQDSAWQYVSAALTLSKKVDDKTFQVEAYNQWGNYLQRKSLADSALDIYQQSMTLSKELNYLEGLAKSTNNIALIEVERGDYPKALENFYQSIGYEEKLANKSGIAEGYNNIGVVFYYQKDYDKSLEYLKKALVLHQDLGNTLNVKQAFNNIGGINQMLGRIDTALFYYQKSLKLSEKLKDEDGIAKSYNNFAGIYKSLKDYEKSEAFYQKAINLNEARRDYSSLALNYINLAQLYQLQERMPISLSYFEKALEISRTNDFKQLRAEVYQRLVSFYSADKNYQKALVYSSNLRALEDSLFNETKSKALAEAETRYESAKKDQALAEQEAALVKEQLKVKQKNLWLILLVAAVIVILLITTFIYRQQKLKEERMQSEALLRQERAKAELRQKMEAERLRISRDLHDHIGTQLTIIGSNIDSLAYQEKEEEKRTVLEGISDHSRSTMHQLRETIWAMNAEGINMNMLVAKLQEFLRRANTLKTSMLIENLADENLSLSPNQTIALFRICQEAANNAIKYAEFSLFKIKFSSTPTQLLLEISDDGKGMPLAEKSRGYGLSNMAQRAKDIQAEFKIESAPNEGCKITIVLGLDQALREFSA